jgi:xylulokinase
LPYFLGEKTPIFDAKARGVMFGLTLSHTSAHIFRAILESVIYGFKHHIEVIERLGFKCKHIRATNGGAKSAFWCQIASDVLGTEIVSFAHHPGSALGVAYLAGMSVGMFDDWERIKDFLDGGGIYKPDPRRSKIYAKSYRVYRNLYSQLKPSFDDIQGLYSMDADSD